MEPFICEVPKFKLKSQLSHLRYVFFGRNKTLPVIIVKYLNGQQVQCLLSLSKRFK